MKKIKIIALYGKSGSGKDTIQKWIVDNYPGVNGIVSTTTRPPRDYEIDKIDYNFIKENEFNLKIVNGDMIEYTVFNDWYYGTSFSSLKKDKINIGVFNLAGVKTLMENDKIDVLPIEIQASDKMRLKRAMEREKNPDYKEICRRFLTDEEDFKNIHSKIIYSNNVNNRQNFHTIFNLVSVKEWINKDN